MDTIVKLAQLATAVLNLLGAWDKRREDQPKARGRHFAADDAKGRDSVR